ncbi:MAG: bifunctional hydroxymethylpyrimidine kinase/phosphomethylpyrimidine kinase, partial [bacterium]|nr:bifunctional hydroxymethylpyrimidine kinase/phosphomethylpyrimidine kinase [bacterium]
WNAAGIGLDLLVLRDLGMRGASVIAGVVAQGPEGASAAWPAPPGAIRAQLAALSGLRVGAYRIGLLLSASSVREVAESLAQSVQPIVVDPVFAASRGGAFADEQIVAAYREALIPRATLFTPNAGEAARIVGRAIETPGDAEHAARALQAMGARAVLVKGGHVAGDEVVDVLVDREGVRLLRDARLAVEMRGTGCILAVTAAAALAQGSNLVEAVIRARREVRQRMLTAVELGGMRVAR